MLFEGIDNDHGRTAGLADIGVCAWMIVSGIGLGFWRIDAVIEAFIAEELPQSFQLFNTNVVCEQTVVTDAVKA